MQIKKAYVAIVEFLEANTDKSVTDVLDTVKEMAAAKSSRGSAGSTYLMDTEGNPVAILCYYFKRWMPLVGEEAVEFGAKKATATGLNSMCKEGNSLWNKQQRTAKKELEGLLGEVAEGNIAPEDILGEQERIENERKVVAETELGFETKDDVVAYLAENDVELPATAE